MRSLTPRMPLILVALCILLFTSWTRAFVLQSSRRSSRYALRVTQEDNQPKYKELLEKAKQARDEKRSKNKRANGPGKTAPPGAGFSVRDMTSFKNKVPFSEDVYETLKFTIQTLSARMKDKKPIAPEVLEKLEDAVQIILQDARLPPPPPPSSP